MWARAAKFVAFHQSAVGVQDLDEGVYNTGSAVGKGCPHAATNATVAGTQELLNMRAGSPMVDTYD